MERRVLLTIVLGLIILGIPLTAQSYVSSRQLSGLESQISSINQEIDALWEEISTLKVGNSTGEPIILEKVFNKVFKLTRIIANDTYALGEPIHFTLKLSNIGNETVVIYHAWMDLLRYRVINPSGDMIYYKNEAPGEIVLPVIVDENLGPNMTYEKLFIWRQVYQDYYNEAWPYDENPITTPGNYTIIGQTYFYLKENDSLGIVEAKLQIEIRII